MKKIPYQEAKTVLSYFELSEEASELIEEAMAPLEVIEALNKGSLYIDLASFFSHALPMRESIWWAIKATGLRKSDITDEEVQVINDCEEWVKHPNEAMRRHIEKSIEPLKNESCAKWVGQAVFWSGLGSIAPAENPVVMPADYLHAKAVSGAVNTAAALPEWSGYKSYYKRVFQMAMDIANGGSGHLEQGEHQCQAQHD